MPNINEVLKAEIARVARKEFRAETESLKKAQSAHRADIAAMKRRVQELERQFRALGKAAARSSSGVAPAKDAGVKLRFSAKGLASRRALLGLSAHDCGLLVGTSGQSIYAWEDGKSRPREKYLPAIAELRRMGKKEAAAKLESLRSKA